MSPDTMRPYLASVTPEEAWLLKLPDEDVLFLRPIGLLYSLARVVRDQSTRAGNPYRSSLAESFMSEVELVAMTLSPDEKKLAEWPSAGEPPQAR